MPREKYFKQQEVFNNVENVKMKTENINLINNIEVTDGSRDQLDWCVLRVNGGGEKKSKWWGGNTDLGVQKHLWSGGMGKDSEGGKGTDEGRQLQGEAELRKVPFIF